MNNIFKCAAGLLTLAIFAVPAYAADIPKGPVYKAAPAAVFDWSGFYAGVDAGYLSSDGTHTVFAGGGAPFPALADPNGFVGGAHLGYRWQLPSRIVLGVEADVWGTDASGTAPAGALVQNGVLDLNWGASLRGVVGIALSPTLLYVTGGVSYIDYQGCTTAGGGCVVGTSFNGSDTGWTIGVGLAHAFSPRLIARIEYLYADYGEKTYSTPLVGVGITTVDLQTHVVRGGISYRF